MPKKASKPIKPGSAEAGFAFEGAMAVIRQQIAGVDEIEANIGNALNELTKLELFSKDRSTLSPEQVQLLEIVAHGILEAAQRISTTLETVDSARALLKGEKEI